MKSLSQHNYDRHKWHKEMNDERWIKSGVGCVDCGAELLMDNLYTFTTNPPQKHVKCPKCGKISYMVV